MKGQEADATLKKICSKCGKRVAGGRRAGSFTAFMFGGSDCACERGGGGKAGSPRSGQIDAEVDFCPKCGLQIVSDARDGSLTGFLFQSTRCKCPADKAFADGQMSDKFWKLKRAGGDTIFVKADNQHDRTDAKSINLAAGAIIGGAYKVIELIGRGGMGEVYLARHETLGKKCALKVIPPDQVTEIGWQRFQLEAKAVAKLDHVNLVRVTDLGIHDGCLPYFAMDFVDGKNLAEIIAERGPIPLNDVLEIFMQVCDGVEHAHRAGILHRDLKPGNIMVVLEKSGYKGAKILDFGLAKLTGHDRSKQSLTAVGDIFGSPFYMSPEQCTGDRIDHRSDIYSLGCTMFECLTGRPPFVGTMATSVMFSHQEADPPALETVAGAKKFPQSLEIVMAKLLRKNPVERYQTLSQLKSDLENVADGRNVLPVYAGREKKTSDSQTVNDDREESDSRRLAGAFLIGGICIVVLLSFALAGTLYFNKTPKKQVAAAASATLPYDDHKIPVFSDPNEQGQNVTDARGNKIVLPKSGYFSRTITKDGKQYVQFDFPKINQGQALGYIGTSITEIMHIDGPLIFPKNLKVQLMPTDGLCQLPRFFEMFRAGDIDGICHTSESSDKLVILSTKVPGIRVFSISACDALTEKIIPFLDKLHIVAFSASASIDGSDYAKLHFLPKLQTLSLVGCHNVSPILRQISGSKNLTSLDLSRTKLTAEDIELVARLPNLTRLNITDNRLNLQDIRILAQLPKLQELAAVRIGLGHKLPVEDLSRFPSLKSLEVSPGSILMLDRILLRKSCPQLRVVEVGGDILGPHK